MTVHRALAASTAIIALWAATAGVCHAAGPPRRFALVLGNNVGEPPAEDLRYAEDDAKKVAAVLVELGGYRTSDVRVLTGRYADDARAALDRIEGQVAAATGRGHHVTLLVYYSGHARAGQLWMNGTRLPLVELRRRLSRASAKVRIGIVDACEAGALTRLKGRTKGGRRGPSFLFEPDDRTPARGLILISSSADDESSQESDELGGSFFTHYLTSGLRGDADESGEGRITLGEVYGYAYHRTVATTAGTRSGPQHPTYRFDLEGQADVVLTDVSQGRSGLVFGAPLSGRYLLFDRDRAQVAAEIDKTDGESRRLALPAGRYVIKKRMADHLLTDTFDLADGRFHWVDETRMQRVAFEDDPIKGLQMAQRRPPRGVTVGVRAVGVYQGFFDRQTREDLFPALPMFGLAVEVDSIFGANVSLEVLGGARTGAPFRLDGLELRQDFWQLETAIGATWGMRLGEFSLHAGPRIAGQYMQRRFASDSVLSGTVQDHFGFSPAVLTAARWHPFDVLTVELTGRLGVLLFGVDDNRALPYGEAGLSVGVTP